MRVYISAKVGLGANTPNVDVSRCSSVAAPLSTPKVAAARRTLTSARSQPYNKEKTFGLLAVGMTIVASGVSALTREVSEDLTSVSTTTQQTLRILRALLGLDLEEKNIKAPPKRPRNTSKPAAATNASGSRTLAPKGRRIVEPDLFEIYEPPKSNIQCLPLPGRRKLATEAFNVSLKNLAESVKQRRAGSRATDSSPNKTQVHPPSKATPLQPCSPNRRTKATQPACTDLAPDTNITVTAECASSALDCLRQLDEKNEKQKLEDILRREHGGLILLDKLVSLDQTQQAVSQVMKLSEQYWKRRKVTQPSRSANPRAFDASEYLSIETDHDVIEEFRFVTSFQSQVLRLTTMLESVTINPTLVKSIQLRNCGSPASIVLKGRDVEFLDDEKAGQQLRTISLVLSKLYSKAMTQKFLDNEKAKVMFHLLVEALSIKCKSWELLQHKPDLDRELWTPFLQGARRLSNTKLAYQEMYEELRTHSQTLSNELGRSGFDSGIPKAVVVFMANSADKSNNPGEAIRILEKHSHATNSTDLTETILLKWRKAAALQIEEGQDHSVTLSCLEDALVSFGMIDTVKDASDDVLLQCARLRRTCSAVVSELEKSTLDCGPSTKTATQVCCARILMKLLEFSQHLQKNPKCPESVSARSRPLPRSFLMNSAKSIEAVLLLDRSSMVVTSLEEEYSLAVERCHLMLESLQQAVAKLDEGDLLIDFTNGLLVRLSNLHWSHYIRSHGQSELSVDLQLVKRSVEVVRQSSPATQRLASLGTKFERLAIVQLQSKNVTAARQAYEDAIEHYVLIDATKAAAENALSKASHQVWTKVGSKVYSLGKALGSHAKIAVTHDLCSTRSGSWLYDNTDLAPIQRCVILEQQLTGAFEQDLSEAQVKASITSIQTVLKLCANSDHQVYRIRFALGLFKAAAQHPSLQIGDILDQMIPESCNIELAKHCALASFAPALQSCLRIQQALHCSRIDLEVVKDQIRALGTIISSCSTSEEIDIVIDDLDFCCRQLRTVSAYARLIDCTDLMLSCLLAQKHALITRLGNGSQHLIQIWTQLGALHSGLGDLASASRAFVSAEELVAKCETPTWEGLRWIFAYIQHFMNVDNISQVEEMLMRASVMFTSASQSLEPLTSRQRLERDSILSTAASVTAQLAYRRGDLQQANHFARQAVKISAAIWRAVEQPALEATESPTSSQEGSSLQLLTAEMSGLTISSFSSRSRWQSKGAVFWDHVDQHYTALSYAAFVSAHDGLYQDAHYYSEQLYKMAQSTGSEAWRNRAQSMLALLYAKAGYSSKALGILKDLDKTLDRPLSVEHWRAVVYQIDALLELDNLDQATQLLEKLEDCLTQLHNNTEVEVGTAKKATTDSKSSLPRSRSKSTRFIKAPAKHPLQRSVPKVSEVGEAASTSGFQFQQGSMKDVILTFRSRLQFIQTKRSPDVLRTKVQLSDVKETGSFELQINTAMAMLQQALHEFSSDATKCVLAETAVALPVKYTTSRKNGRVSFIQAVDAKSHVKARRAVRGKPKAADSPAPVVTEGERMLAAAYKILHNLGSKHRGHCPSDLLHLAGKMQSKLALLSSVTNAPFTISTLELVLESSQPKDTLLMREQFAIKAERDMNQKTQLMAWPVFKASVAATVPQGCLTNIKEEDEIIFNTEAYISQLQEILPTSWSVISLSLSDDLQELLISKLSKRSPFLLRIPLSRSELELDDDSFSFHDVRSELMDIIAQANDSCHDPRGSGDKENRLTWYAERKALDERLGALLSNIENLWLGGFRGALTPFEVDEPLTARFEQLLFQILQNHLPSRSRQKPISSPPVELHAHVLELFLALGDPDDESQELEDPLTDLLSFVVDILQFSGEMNAYDEIDFDAMLVDVLDALRSCRSTQADESRHTILVVDKELAAIPWESLPCLQNQSISRMPSLSAITQRLKKVRDQKQSEDGYIVSGDHGAYLLNPSSDLVSTQNTFTPILQSHLPGFASSINKPPTESEFESVLRDNDLFLYFGHGAGAQYIRGRKIRSLDSCAVTLLMGCSSAKMTECGKYESYGMPGYYINGLSGCMAVVGTLWDVTDRDIDRFALQLMVEWGLIPDDEVVTNALEKPKKKGTSRMAKNKKTKAVSVQQKRGKIALDEAVRKGRDACALRYLNGAAPVVYGVPVYLS